MSEAAVYKWEFRARFRRHAFGWRSQPAIKRIKEAVSEIKKVARKDKALAAEGAVLFLEKVSPALEHVDSSSGAIGTAVNNAIVALVKLIASTPADAKTREKWLERLWDAYQDDEIPYIELLGDYWAISACPRTSRRSGPIGSWCLRHGPGPSPAQFPQGHDRLPECPFHRRALYRGARDA